ncbi:DUF4870 domain-containing protein [Amnibacterium endophyticum]|uniref:DUF4870 domain-containing protein n=1 Tax=Amnibacterium endophyticum TaxID=2109337 RepID=A0ABW4LFV0_9MICO
MTDPAPAAQPLTPENERLWAVMSHVSALVGIVVGVGTIGWLGPLIIFLVFKDRSPFVRQQAATTLNFQITMAIASVIAIALWIVLVGFLLTAAIYVVTIVFSIIAAVSANKGRPYTYPLSFPMIR